MKQFCVIQFLITIVLGHETLEVTNDVSLENVMQQILQITPPDMPVGKFKQEQQPPKHMLELYHRFTSGRRASGETVRSITPISDLHAGGNHRQHHHQHIRDMMVFNLSHIGADEEVRLAQLVLRRRRLARHPHPMHRKLLAPPYRVRVYQVVTGGPRPRTVPLASIPVPQVSRGGWHSLDITSAVRELLLTSSDSSDQLTLGVRFEAPRSRVISPAHFLDQKNSTSSAFLMVFSDESGDNEIAGDSHRTGKKPAITPEHIALISKHMKNQAESNHIKQRHHLHHSRIEAIEDNNPHRHKNKQQSNTNNEDTDIKELIAMNRVKSLKRHRKLFDDIKYDDERESEKRTKIKSNLIDELLENSETRRVIRSIDGIGGGAVTSVKTHRRRSIYDNELPFDKLHIKDISKTLITTTEVMPDVNTESHLHSAAEDEDDDKNLIPYPPGTEKRKNRRGGRRGKKKMHRKKAAKIADKWNTDEGRRRQFYTDPGQANSSEGNQTCSRRHLVVNFADLGWSDWIIAPALFNAHYCAGSCSFPIPENLQMTNHAIIQELVHEKDKHVPAPCCVPYSMSPITILYLEDDNHVTLKNYRSMTVETCGCR